MDDDTSVNYKNSLIIIKNVPCVECVQCGEKFI
ncbi:MAG: YgiT-type zinc finger protein [Selenomonadaceae bacterium]|nr:YgiT-type zinc finger protein [Selenomonadaceae bacterium]